jgi:hypothetical protein
MTILFANNASTTVAGSITASSTTVNLAAGTGMFFPPVATGSGNYFCATFYDQATKTINEIVHVTNLSGDVATIVRGQEGTTPRAWTSGDIFANLVTAGTLQAFVQAGIIAANTEIVYTGIDVSVDPHHIVCNTVPVPASYNTGMVFTIKVGGSWPAGVNANYGPIDLQLNGNPGVLAKRTDGSDMIPGNLIKNQEYLFMYNGTFFSTTFPPIPQAPPQYTFYVRSTAASTIDSNGIESASGLANTDTDAFKSIQGAINTIKNRYISALTITIRVADGTYTSGFADNTQYIGAWSIVGNSANPGNVNIVCTSTNPATYIPYAPVGVCVGVGAVSVMYVQGMSFQSYEQQCLVDGVLQLYSCHFTSPITGLACIDSAGVCNVYGYCQYSGPNSVSSIFAAHAGGQISLGYYDPYVGTTVGLQFTIVGSPICTVGVFHAFEGGTASIYDIVCTFPGGTVIGPDFTFATTGGGGFWTSNIGALPGNSAGVVTTASYGDPGGWLTHG